MISIIAGVAMATSMILWARTQKSAKLIFNLSLLTLPGLYIFFAIYFDNHSAITDEALWGIPFFLAPLLLISKARGITLSILALLYLGHGGYDLAHSKLISGDHVPVWYPTFCAALDFVVGIYLALAATSNIDKKLQYA